MVQRAQIGIQARIEPPPAPAATVAAAPAPAPRPGSCVSAAMMIIGRVACTGDVRVLGRITGDLTAGCVFVGDNGTIEGDIVAREAAVRGRVRGDIRAGRVKLQGRGAVDGDIFHQTLSIEEFALFEGASRPLGSG